MECIKFIVYKVVISLNSNYVEIILKMY